MGTSKKKETVEGWIEQFEMVAAIGHWDKPTKLANLTTRLRSQAYTFYRSCTPRVRANYEELVAELKKRFTPVRIQSVQSSQFHDRRQKPQETVDGYAQDLRRLFHRAYPRAQQGAQELEDMGQSVLAYQFVSGLLPQIKMKLAGVEGSFDQLLVKARFQEAKLRDLAGVEAPPATPLQQNAPYRSIDGGNTPPQIARGRPNPQGRCFHCDGAGHFARHCPLRGRAAPIESPGPKQGNLYRNEPRKVATIAVSEEEVAARQKQKQKTVAELRQQLQEAELEESLARVTATMHVLRPEGRRDDLSLGPALTAEVNFEGTPIRAFLDTGSPVTVVSLRFLLQALAKQRPAGQTPAEWQKSVRNRLHPPTIKLNSYGGGELNVIKQLTAVLSRGNRQCRATVLVQKDAPLDFLLGTDLQAKLGFFVLQTETDGTVVDLLQKPSRNEERDTRHTYADVVRARTPSQRGGEM